MDHELKVPMMRDKKAPPYMYHSCHARSVLICICLLTFGSYWVYDTPGAIFAQLQAWFGGESEYTSSQNLLLYSIYSWPNTVLAFFGGYIIDRITGVRLGSIMFCALILVGQAMFAFGVQYRMYYLCVAGRLVFGLGGESLTVVQNTYTLRWFEGPNLALVFGLVLAFARVGSSVNFAVTPLIAGMGKSGVPISVWFGTGLTLFSFGICLLGSYLDKSGGYILQKRAEDAQGLLDLEESESSLGGDELLTEVEEEMSITHVRRFPLRAWILFLNCMIFYNAILTFYAVASDIIQNAGPYYDVYYQLPPGEFALCQDYNKDVPSHYQVSINSTVCADACNALDTCSGYQEDARYCLWFTPEVVPAPAGATFVDSPGGDHSVSSGEEKPGTTCYKRGHEFSPDTATLFLSIPNFVSIFASPFFGGLVDRKGRALIFIMVASVMLIVAHVGFLSNALEWVNIHPIIIMLWLGIAYAMGAAALWPTVALIVPANLVSTAYGCMTSVQNLGLALVPLIIGTVQSMDGVQGTSLKYSIPILIFIGCGVCSFFLALINLILDTKAGGGVSIMNAKASDRKRIQREQADRERAARAAQAAPGLDDSGFGDVLTPNILGRVRAEDQAGESSRRVVNSRFED